MKKLLPLLLLLVGLCQVQTAEAQFLKKLAKAAKSLTEQPVAKQQHQLQKTSAPVYISNGVEVTNPFSEFATIEFVGAYGDSQTKQVRIEIRLLPKQATARIEMSRTKAYDSEGNLYQEASGKLLAESYKAEGLVEGIPVKLTLIKDLSSVPPTLTQLLMVTSEWYISAGSRYKADLSNFIKLRNVPIRWDAKP